MKHNHQILAIIPARGGSKGIPLKNLAKLGKCSLLGHVASVLNECDYINEKVVSTDHEAIVDESLKYDLLAPFVRPDELSGDHVSDYDVLYHALISCEETYNKRYDLILMIQPTSPLRKKEHIDRCVDKIITGGFDAVWTISKVDLKYHPYKALSVEEGRLEFFSEEGRSIIARQQLKPTYIRNGSCYAFTRNAIIKHKTILPPSSSYIVIEDELISIDTPEDLNRVEQIIRNEK